jgi:hypothetical protein
VSRPVCSSDTEVMAKFTTDNESEKIFRLILLKSASILSSFIQSATNISGIAFKNIVKVNQFPYRHGQALRFPGG